MAPPPSPWVSRRRQLPLRKRRAMSALNAMHAFTALASCRTWIPVAKCGGLPLAQFWDGATP
eukprot:11032770-Prorocentrum_lima.AAC.1